MAQRSARARVKLDKISSNGIPSSPTIISHPHSHRANKGVAKIGSGGLITPSASSVSGSSRNSFQHSGPKIGKSSLRSFFDSHSEKIRGRLSSGGSLGKKDGAYGLGLGLGQGLGLGGGLFGEEKTVVKRWEGGGRRGELWDGGGRGRKVGF